MRLAAADLMVGGSLLEVNLEKIRSNCIDAVIIVNKSQLVQGSLDHPQPHFLFRTYFVSHSQAGSTSGSLNV